MKQMALIWSTLTANMTAANLTWLSCSKQVELLPAVGPSGLRQWKMIKAWPSDKTSTSHRTVGVARDKAKF